MRVWKRCTSTDRNGTSSFVLTVSTFDWYSKYVVPCSFLLSRVCRVSRAELAGDKSRPEPHRIKRLEKSIC